MQPKWGDMIRKSISCALAGLLTVVSALAFLSGLLGYWEPSSGLVVLSLMFGFAAITELDEGTFTEGHELDRKWRVPKEMIGRRLSQGQAKKLLAKFE